MDPDPLTVPSALENFCALVLVISVPLLLIGGAVLRWLLGARGSHVSPV